MKAIIIFAAVVAVAVAFPSPQESAAVVLTNENNNIGVGDFQARYATSNNIQADESGELRQGGSDGAYLVKRGSYSFTGQDGVTYTINYTADENGFHPEGAHIPRALV